MRKPPPDESAAIVSALVTVAGASGLMGKLGMTADDLALLLGSLMTVAALVRAWWLRRAPKPAYPEAPSDTELTK